MVKRRKPPFALWLSAVILVAALIGGLVGALIMAHSSVPEGDDGRSIAVVSAPAEAGHASPVLPTGEASRAPVIAAPTGSRPKTGLAVPSQRLGAPRFVLAVVDDETGAPVGSFDVLVMPAGDDPPLERARTTEVKAMVSRSPSGIFRTECKSGHWDVVVRAPGYLPGVLPDLIVPPELPDPIPMRLSHGPSITGLVYDDGRAPVADVPVFLDVVRLFSDDVPPKIVVTHTTGDGRFRFSPLPAGEHSVTLLEPGNERDRLRSVVVNQGTTDVSLFLTPRHQVVASVRDSFGHPVSDADIEVRSPTKFASGRTLDSGQAVLRFLPDGEYEVSVRHEGFEPLTETLQLQGGQGEQLRWYTLREKG